MNKIFKNFIEILKGNIAAKVLTFIFFLIVARSYGEEAFGALNFANSIITYFIMIGSMGLQSYAIVCIAKNQNDSEELFNKVLSARIILAVISIILLLIMLSISNMNEQNKIITLIYGGLIISNTLNIDWYFNAIQEMEYISKSIIIQNMVSLGALVTVLIIDKSRNIYIVPITLFAGGCVSGIYLIKTSLKNIKIKFIFSFNEFWKFIKEGIPFFFSGIFATINCNIDIILLGILVGNAQVGLYSSAYKIINILIVVVTLVFTPIYPVIIKMINESNWNDFNDLMSKVKKYVYLMAFPLVMGGIILGEDIIVFLFGENYREAGDVFKILIIYISVIYIREIYGYILTASGNQRIYMKVVSISATVNIILNIILIPIMGIVGSALTTLISELINFMLMKKICYEKLPLKLNGNFIIKILMSIIIMGICIYTLKFIGVNILINILIGATIYIIMIFTLKIININEIKNTISIKY